MADLSTSQKINKVQPQSKNETENGPFDKNDGDIEMAKVEDSQRQELIQ